MRNRPLNGRVRVVHIYKDFDVFNGLIETFYVMAKYHDSRRFDVSVCVLNYAGGVYGKTYRQLGGKLHSLDCGVGIGGLWKSVFRLGAFISRETPDIVVTRDRRCNLIGIPVAAVKRVPVIIGTETTQMHSAATAVGRLRDRLLHPVLLAVVALADGFVANSRRVAHDWRFARFATKVRVIHPSFNLEKYQRVVPAGSESSIARAPIPVVGYIGRLSEEKGLQYLILSLPSVRKSFPRLRVLVAGSGKLERYYQSLARAQGVDDCIDFLGFQQNSFEILSRISVLVVPSRSEGFGVTILEAMAMGVPVVASNVGGIPEIVTREVGVLVPVGQPEALGSAIVDLLADPDRSRRMGQCGRRRAFQEFTPQAQLGQFEELYVELLAASEKGRGARRGKQRHS